MPTRPPGLEPPAPSPGSARFFALLYTPASRRDAMSRLLAVADELGAGTMRPLDPAVAQARLAWWQLEAERHAVGNAQHPWLRPPADLPTSALQVLIDAAAQDPGEALRRAVFRAAAALLQAELSTPQQHAALDALAAQAWRAEQSPPTTLRSAAADLRALQPLQRRLAPLLVWAALAGGQAPGTARLRSLIDNLRAWNVARRALAGRYIQA